MSALLLFIYFTSTSKLAQRNELKHENPLRNPHKDKRTDGRKGKMDIHNAEKRGLNTYVLVPIYVMYYAHSVQR